MMGRLSNMWMPRCSCGVTSFMDDFGNIHMIEDAAKIRYILKGW